jgi:SAM-dependent methyltransferase
MSDSGISSDSWGEEDNALHYDAFAREYPMYRDASRDLIALARLPSDAVVVDLACGTGATSQEILAVLGPSGKVIGVDRSAAMLAMAARTVVDPRVSWIQAPVENVHLYLPDKVDAVLCNSAIWQTNFSATTVAVRKILSCSGCFVFNVGSGFLHQQFDPCVRDDPPLIRVMKTIAADDYGWRPPDPAKPRRGRSWLSRESICRHLDDAGFEVERVEEFTHEQSAETERAWLSVPIFTRDQLSGLPYEDRMRVLAKACARLGPGRAGLLEWVVFAARARAGWADQDLPGIPVPRDPITVRSPSGDPQWTPAFHSLSSAAYISLAWHIHPAAATRTLVTGSGGGWQAIAAGRAGVRYARYHSRVVPWPECHIAIPGPSRGMSPDSTRASRIRRECMTISSAARTTSRRTG